MDRWGERERERKRQRQREREGERERSVLYYLFFLNPSEKFNKYLS